MRKAKISRRQKVFSAICKALAGDVNEERATNLLPEAMRIRGMRLWLYKLASRLRYYEGARLVRKYRTHVFEA